MAKVEVKRIRDRATLIADAWSQTAIATSFGGLAHTAFQGAVDAAASADGELADLEAQVVLKQTEISDLYSALNDSCNLVVNGVKGDPTFGDDSGLYEAMGYVRKSERKSGLTRKKKTP